MFETQVDDALTGAAALTERCEADSFRDWLRGEVNALLQQAEGIDVMHANPEHRGVFRRLYHELLARSEPMSDDQTARFGEIQTRYHQYETVFRADDLLYFAYEKLALAQSGDERVWGAIAQYVSVIESTPGLTNDQHERLYSLREQTEMHFPHVAQRIHKDTTIPDDPRAIAGVPQ